MKLNPFRRASFIDQFNRIARDLVAVRVPSIPTPYYDGQFMPDDREARRVPVMDANLVSSEIVDRNGNPTGKHKVAIDIDLPHCYVPSSTPGHGHLIIDTDLDFEAYEKLLTALREAGIIEKGFLGAARVRRATWLRTPWTKKGV